MGPYDDDDDDSEDESGDLRASALGVLGGPALPDASSGGLGARDEGRRGRHVGRKSTTFEAIGGADDRVEAEGTTMEVNPFEVDERELEARASEPMGVGLEATPKVKETREDVALGNGDDDSNGTIGASGGGVLENGRHHAGDGMTYGDFFAPLPSYADSVVYTRPETYSRVWGVLRYG